MRTEGDYIVYKCLNGDTSAFGLLVDKYKEAVYTADYKTLNYPSLDPFHGESEFESLHEALNTFGGINQYEGFNNRRKWSFGKICRA